MYQVLEMTLIDAVKEKQFKGVDVSLIALPVKVQLKMLRGELIQHGIFIKTKSYKRVNGPNILCFDVLHIRKTLRLSPSILPQMALSHF